MTVETLALKEICILPELFLGMSLIYLVLHCTFLSINNNFPLIQNSTGYLIIQVLIFVLFLIVNDNLYVLNDISNLNNMINNDFSSFITKIIIICLSICSVLIIQQYLIDQKINHFEYLLLILFSVLGLLLLCSSNDFITAYLAIELQSLAFYVLAAFKKNSSFSVEAGLKYFILGSFSSCLFLFGSAMIYGFSGTVNFSEFKELFYSMPNESFLNTNFELIEINLLQLSLFFILISLFFKLAVAPFHVWSPDVYEGSPSSSSFFFSVVPKLAVFLLVLRIFHSSFFNLIENWRYVVTVFIILTIIAGAFGGLEQRKLKSLLVYSSISHVGYSLIAFSTGSLEGLQMLFCYLLIYSFSGLCIWSIFILLRVKNKFSSKQNKDLGDLVSLGKSNNLIALCFLTVLLSVAGFPPMVGFLVKINVFLSAIESSMFFLVLVSILCSVIATFYYIRLIKIMYFEKSIAGKLYYPIKTQKSIIVVLLFFSFLFLFINPTVLFLVSYKFSLLF